MLRNDGQLERRDQIAVRATAICFFLYPLEPTNASRAVATALIFLCPTSPAFPASAPSNTAVPEVLTGFPHGRSSLKRTFT